MNVSEIYIPVIYSLLWCFDISTSEHIYHITYPSILSLFECPKPSNGYKDGKTMYILKGDKFYIGTYTSRDLSFQHYMPWSTSRYTSDIFLSIIGCINFDTLRIKIPLPLINIL